MISHGAVQAVKEYRIRGICGQQKRSAYPPDSLFPYSKSIQESMIFSNFQLFFRNKPSGARIQGRFPELPLPHRYIRSYYISSREELRL